MTLRRSAADRPLSMARARAFPGAAERMPKSFGTPPSGADLTALLADLILACMFMPPV